jgi:hypothetical protein
MRAQGGVFMTWPLQYLKPPQIAQYKNTTEQMLLNAPFFQNITGKVRRTRAPASCALCVVPRRRVRWLECDLDLAGPLVESGGVRHMQR